MKKSPLGETKIYYDRWGGSFLTLIFGVSTIYLFYHLLINDFSFMLLFVLLMSGWLSIKEAKQLFNKTPQLIINSKGIKPINRKLFTWNYVAHTRIRQTSGRNASSYLQLYRKGEKGQPKLITEIDITKLGISCSKLKSTILEYRREIRVKKKKH